jgi:hypothetical protein
MAALPNPVARFVELAMRESPHTVETAVIETSAWMRRPGMPRLPLEIGMFHRLGHEFVHDIRIGRRPLAFRFGLDAYVGSRGVMKIGRSVEAGAEFDQGAIIAMWAEVLGLPWSWQGRADVRWEPVDEQAAALIVPGPEGEIRIEVYFDPVTGCPTQCAADRHKSRGPKVRWVGRSTDWRRFERGVLCPGRFTAQWADEPFPWIDITTNSVRVDVPVDAALELGRRALRAAAPDGSNEP